jgi:glutathione S-transferase
MAHLGLSCDVERLDILASPSETRRPEFLAKNPNGRIPVVELEDGSHLAESNAILIYLAEGTAFLPDEPLERARVLSWMFFEQYSHERFIAVLKFWTFWGGLASRAAEQITDWRTQGQAALSVMNTHLSGRRFFVADRLTVADLALYAYTHTAAESGYDMEAAPAVTAWLDRVSSAPGHVPIWGGPGSPGWKRNEPDARA